MSEERSGPFKWAKRNAPLLISTLFVVWGILAAVIMIARVFAPVDPVEADKVAFGYSLALAFLVVYGVLPVVVIQSVLTISVWRGIGAWHRVIGIIPGVIVFTIWAYLMLFTRM